MTTGKDAFTIKVDDSVDQGSLYIIKSTHVHWNIYNGGQGRSINIFEFEIKSYWFMINLRGVVVEL